MAFDSDPMARHGDPADGVRISVGGATASIDSRGGRLRSLEVDGHEVLVTEGEKPTRWGSFPMIPWCGRLPGGLLYHAGNEYRFPLTNERHANHGQAHLLDWDVTDQSQTSAKIATRLQSPWVFGGLVRQRFELDGNSLSIEVQVEAEDYPMPVMAGWHPWFRRQLAIGDPAELRVNPGRRWMNTWCRPGTSFRSGRNRGTNASSISPNGR